MKIVHMCLSCFYIDGYAYQENELVAQNIADGHDVVVIASTETFDERRQIAYAEARTYIGTDGAKVIRLPYSGWLPHKVMRKLRFHPGVYDLLQRERPDAILFHGLCGWELNTVARYKRAYPATRLFVDCHEDFNNSARSFISKYILHWIYYRLIVAGCLNVIDKVLCISQEAIQFAHDFYRIPLSKLEFFPLGGKVLNDGDYAALRHATRECYRIRADDTLLIQSGKMGQDKKVLESLRAFITADDPKCLFILAGHLDANIADDVAAILADDARIRFVGWKTPQELYALLCAADVYVQPGTQSATMQMSLCCRCAVILADVPSHQPFVAGNGWLVSREQSLEQIFAELGKRKAYLPQMSGQSAAIATRLLDYKNLATRYCAEIPAEA